MELSIDETDTWGENGRGQGAEEGDGADEPENEPFLALRPISAPMSVQITTWLRNTV